MAKVLCSCGTVLSDNSSGHYYKGRCIPDLRWDEFWVAVDSAIETSGPSPKEKEAACMALYSIHEFRPMGEIEKFLFDKRKQSKEP
ncbi:MAG: hypothetical protein M3Q07_28245 [Pseudobdellovibrionaceae bacterium]|nr:hypothetical protein [Pseudobdellovibrionaceae bacterium]